MAAVAVGAALGLAGLSAVEYETLKDHLDPISVDRDADLMRTEFEEIVWRFRLLAAGFLALALVLLACGRSIDSVTARVGHAWWSSIRRSPRSSRSWIASEHPAYIATFALILVVGTALRLAYLDVPMRYDEATTYNNFVSKPLYVALAHYPTPNNHLLHTFLAKISVAAFGNEPWAIRLPALMAGIAIIPTTFALGRVLYGRTAALLAAALVASSSTLVEYSVNARGYTIVALFTVVALIAASRALDDDLVGSWAVVAVTSALGLYAVPVMLYPFGGVLVWLAASRIVEGRPLRPFVRSLAACVGVTAGLAFLLYAPVLAASGVRSVTSNEFVEPRSWGTFFDALSGHVHDTVETWGRDLPLVVSAVLAVGLVASLVLTPRLSRFPIPPVLAILGWTLPVILLQRVVPFTRVWLFLVPLALAAVAGFYGWLLDRLPRAEALVPAVAGIVAVSAAFSVINADSVRESRETGALLDAPTVAALLATTVEPGDRILATGSDTILQYYLERDGIDARPLLYTDELRDRTFVVVNVLGEQTLDDLLRQLDAAPRGLGPPRLLNRYPFALVYLVERAA